VKVVKVPFCLSASELTQREEAAEQTLRSRLPRFQALRLEAVAKEQCARAVPVRELVAAEEKKRRLQRARNRYKRQGQTGSEWEAPRRPSLRRGAQFIIGDLRAERHPGWGILRSARQPNSARLMRFGAVAVLAAVLARRGPGGYC
jgi:hypothetical protein